MTRVLAATFVVGIVVGWVVDLDQATVLNAITWAVILTILAAFLWPIVRESLVQDAPEYADRPGVQR